LTLSIHPSIFLQIEDEQRQKDEAREQLGNAERRLASLQAEKDELRHQLDNVRKDQIKEIRSIKSDQSI